MRGPAIRQAGLRPLARQRRCQELEHQRLGRLGDPESRQEQGRGGEADALRRETDTVARLLVPGGELFVQTDVEERAAQYEAQIASGKLKVSEVPAK